MELRDRLRAWPVLRQLRDGDLLGTGQAADSERSRRRRPRIADADPASPISRGRLCPKGAASKSLHSGPLREYRVKYRPPYGTAWEDLPLDRAVDMIADRIVATREATWEAETPDGNPARRTMGIANLGGATLDNEENYLIKKLLSALGVVQVENQARI
jgi:formate dehydrogenase major subunit